MESAKSVMKQIVKRESKVEKACRLLAEKRGWLQFKIEKTNVNGFPDRLFIKDGRTVYVEFKSETGQLRPEQRHVIDKMREFGATVYVISSLEAADAIFD